MRITGGTFRNRPLTAPAGDTVRPASDKVRAAVFNILMHRFPQALDATHVLDLFCGAGSYGFEALSRGAATCTFVDHSPLSLRATRANAMTLGCLAECSLMQRDARRLDGLLPPPDLVFLDPPYTTTLLAETLPGLVPILGPEAVVVCEMPAVGQLSPPDGLTVEVEKTYGATRIVILTRC